MDIDLILKIILLAILLPAFGVGLSAMAGGADRRIARRPPTHPPGWRNIQRAKRNNKRKR